MFARGIEWARQVCPSSVETSSAEPFMAQKPPDRICPDITMLAWAVCSGEREFSPWSVPWTAGVPAGPDRARWSGPYKPNVSDAPATTRTTNNAARGLNPPVRARDLVTRRTRCVTENAGIASGSS